MQSLHSHVLEFRVTNNLSKAHILKEHSCWSWHLFTGIMGGIFYRLLLKEYSTTTVCHCTGVQPRTEAECVAVLVIGFRKQAWQSEINLLSNLLNRDTTWDIINETDRKRHLRGFPISHTKKKKNSTQKTIHKSSKGKNLIKLNIITDRSQRCYSSKML